MAYKDFEKRKKTRREYEAKPETKVKRSNYNEKYYAQPGMKEKKAEKSKEHYKQNRELRLEQCRIRRVERVYVINNIALLYSCQNHECRWDGSLESWQLDFHHLDPTTKTIEVSRMDTSSFKKIVEEINKCVVLCRNCHAGLHHGLFTVDEQNLCKITMEQVLQLCQGMK